MKDHWIKYGPVHPCPTCKKEIVYRSDWKHHRAFAMDADSPLRHVCPKLSQAVRYFDHYPEEEKKPVDIPNGVIMLP